MMVRRIEHPERYPTSQRALLGRISSCMNMMMLRYILLEPDTVGEADALNRGSGKFNYSSSQM